MPVLRNRGGLGRTRDGPVAATRTALPALVRMLKLGVTMAASRTAQYVALYRALENTERRRKPLFRDVFASSFLPQRLRIALRLGRVAPLRRALERYADYRAPGARTSAICRTRFIDDAVRAAIGEGIRQLVILGAGFDCRAHRLEEVTNVHVFEVDHSDTQEMKREQLERVRSSLVRRDVQYVAVDFLRDDLTRQLVLSNWSRRDRSVFVWEGVSHYLSKEAVESVLSCVGGCRSGSKMVFTYIHRGILDDPATFEGGSTMLRNVQRLREPWIFGLEPREVPAFVERFGLIVEEDVGADDYRARYLHTAERGTRGYAFYRIAIVRVRTP